MNYSIIFTEISFSPETSNQHSEPEFVHVCYIGVSSTRSYCGATYNTSLCAMTKGVVKILIFFSEASGASYYAIIFLNAVIEGCPPKRGVRK